MDYEKFTLKTQDALQEASSIANKNDHSEIGLEHLFIALVEQEDGIVALILLSQSADGGESEAVVEVAVRIVGVEYDETIAIIIAVADDER